MRLALLFFIPYLSLGSSFVPELKDVKINDTTISVSKNCKKNCLAIENFKKLDRELFKSIEKTIFGGRTAGDQVCREGFKAEVKYYRDKDQNEYHYCFFKDSSYLDVDNYEMKIDSFK